VCAAEVKDLFVQTALAASRWPLNEPPIRRLVRIAFELERRFGIVRCYRTKAAQN
jgi:hypothetical protein